MTKVEDKLWEQLIEHHDADRVRLPAAAAPQVRRRPIAVGLVAAGVAAAGAATLLTTGSHGSGGVRSRNTAYVVGRVRESVAADARRGEVVHSIIYGRGRLKADGSLVDLGTRSYDEYRYTAADGAVSDHNTMYNLDGTVYGVLLDEFAPRTGDRGTNTSIVINPTRHTYSEQVRRGVALADDEPAPNLNTSPSGVRRALLHGRVTDRGRTTIAGTAAIMLSVAVPGATERFTLYVDARTYQPLRAVQTIHSVPGGTVSDWEPPTAANIARARHDEIPAGYARVKRAL